MVILIGQDGIDTTITKIIECFEYLKFKDYIYINQYDLYERKFKLDLRKMEMIVDERRIDLSKHHTTFLWKIIREKDFDKSNLSIYECLIKESEDVYTNLIEVLSTKSYINNLQSSLVPKFKQLMVAEQSGLLVPTTYLTNSKQTLKELAHQSSTYITKCFNSYPIQIQKQRFLNYTVTIEKEELQEVQDHFFPSIIQEQIEKEIEIRTIYFYGKCYSVAIFSQSNNNTKVDYRNYDTENPNTLVSYQLPKDIEEKVTKFMNKLNLNFGSIDFIKNKENGNYIFLEVNTMGQFDGISNVMNINIHMMLAQKLISLSNYDKQQ